MVEHLVYGFGFRVSGFGFRVQVAEQVEDFWFSTWQVVKGVPASSPL